MSNNFAVAKGLRIQSYNQCNVENHEIPHKGIHGSSISFTNEMELIIMNYLECTM